MKKLILIIVCIITGTLLSAYGKNTPQRPSNIPEGAEWNDYGYYWTYRLPNSGDQILEWYSNGSLKWVHYKSDDKQYTVDENYYQNGNLQKREQQIHLGKKDHKPVSDRIDSYIRYAGKQTYYHENGKLSDERCYTLVMKKSNVMVNVLCGNQVSYDNTGKESKRIEHNANCEYGCDEVPRKSTEELIARIKPYYDKQKLYREIQRWEKSVVVGKIVSIDSSSKVIEIAYKDGFALNIGDWVCCIIENAKVTFECIENRGTNGVFVLKEDESSRFSSVNEETNIRFYRKNEIKNDDFLKPKKKPKAGDVKVIGGVEFVYIPSAEITTMSDGKEYHETIKAFWMQKYETTLGDYLKFSYELDVAPDYINKTAVRFDSRYPVIFERIDRMHTWGYCSWFGSKYGVKARLASWPEWQYAAWGGAISEYYPEYSRMGDYAWYAKNSGKKIHPVGRKKPNEFGLHDMLGNAWEALCSDNALETKDNISAYDSSQIAGGSWNSDETELKYNYRITYFNYGYAEDMGDPLPNIEITRNGVGFRMIICIPE